MTSRRAIRRTKRGNLWLPFDASTTVDAGSDANSADLLTRYLSDVGAEVPVGSTIGPIRGNISLEPVTINAQGAAFCAIYLRREGSNPAPNLDQEPWHAMWYLAAPLTGKTNETAAGVFAPEKDVWPIETRAMRKISDVGEELVASFSEVTSLTDILTRVMGWIFIKLP